MKSIFIQNSIISLLLLSSAIASYSSIHGKVIDSQTGQYLMGANIILEGANLGSASNENGDYLIENVPIGNYTLKTMYIGYKISEQKIILLLKIIKFLIDLMN